MFLWCCGNAAVPSGLSFIYCLDLLPSGNNQSWVVKAALDPSGCNATVDFDDCQMYNNRAWSATDGRWYFSSWFGTLPLVKRGGGMLIGNGIVNLNNCQIYGNAADLGGGLRIENGVVSLSESKIFDNTAQSGGGVFVDAGQVTLTSVNV